MTNKQTPMHNGMSNVPIPNWSFFSLFISLDIVHWDLVIKFILVIAIWSFFAVPASASTISRPMSNSGLVGYWSMEEGTGNSRTFDRSGNGNTGTLTSMDPLTDWVNGNTGLGQALDFDGSDDYVLTTLSTALNDFTACAWFKASSPINNYDRIIDKSYSGGFWLGENSGTPTSWGGGVLEGGSPFVDRFPKGEELEGVLEHGLQVKEPAQIPEEMEGKLEVVEPEKPEEVEETFEKAPASIIN